MSAAAITREEFVARRQNSLGGSDAATIVGLNPWKSAYELWLEKTGKIVAEDISAKEHIYWGTKLEALVAERYSEETGRKIRRNNQQLVHPEYPFIHANLDREVVGDSRILECKTTNINNAHKWGPSGSDQVPDNYQLQVMHYLAVTGKEVADIAVLIGGNEFRYYEIPRNQEVIDFLIGSEVAFWNMVQKKIEPAIDYESPRAMDLIKQLHPGTNGETVFLPNEALAWHEELRAVKEQLKALEDREDVLKAQFLVLMGDAAIGKLPDAQGCYKRKVIDRKAHSVAASEYVDFRYSKKG